MAMILIGISGYFSLILATIRPNVYGRPIPAISLIQISSASELDQLECHLGIILNRMYRRMRDTQGAL